MFPTIKSRDVLLMRSASKIRIGDLVVVRALAIGLIVKRVSQLDSETVELIGDNSRLGSSVCGTKMNRQFVLGKVIASFTLPFKFKFFWNGRFNST